MTMPNWKDMFALTDRVPPEFFEAGDRIANTPYAEEIRKAMQNLSVSGVFCNQGVPQIFILEQATYDRAEVVRTHAALWNQGLASLLVVPSEDAVRVFSLAKAPGRGEHAQFEDSCLIEAVYAGAEALTLKDYVYGAESGRLWLEKAEYFDPKSRIDHVLLNNLRVAHDFLIYEKLTAEEAQAILIQTMFVAYLEDRDIATPDYFEMATAGAHDGLDALLASGEVGSLEKLFSHLQRDFSGDLFVAPCSFDDPDHPRRLSPTAMDVLRRFRDGREEMSEETGQLRFWGYDFRFIPVELISAVYDRFLGQDEEARHDAGAYYTPMFLVDTVVSSVWDGLSEEAKVRGVFMDPACGSGIFLVRSFQRLCEQWREGAKSQTIRWDSLIKMLSRVRGYDLNGSAIRVAVFSLYVALLEEVTPPDIRTLAKKGRLLPTLWNRTLVHQDFFVTDPDVLQVNIIIGNPPWTSRRNTFNSGLVWCKERGYPTPSKEIAWAFLWKAQQHVPEGGTIAFLLPAMGFLHNPASISANARSRLFTETRVKRVVNFADLRKQLFDGAIHPTALIVAERVGRHDSDYTFDYWAPKADLNLTIKRFITMSSVDKSELRLSDVQRNPLIFKQRLWMQQPEAKLYSFLNALPKLSDFVTDYGSLKRTKSDTSTGWVIGQGFQPLKADASPEETNKSYRSEAVANTPFLPIGALSPLAISVVDLVPWESSALRRKGFPSVFMGPRILVSRGVATAANRLRAAFIVTPLTFRHIIQAITVPENEVNRAKFITAVLNSRLAIWFAFHGTSSFGTFLPEVAQAELLKMPMPEPEQLGEPAKAEAIRKKMIAVVDQEQEQAQADQFLCPSNDLDGTLREIDVLTYEYFGLSDDEIAIIEDTVEHVLPAVQPSRGTRPALWKRSVAEERGVYADQLAKSLSNWFVGNIGLSLELIGSNTDFGILRLRLGDVDEVNQYHEPCDQAFTDALQKLSHTLERPIAQNFQTIPNMRVFVGDSLYLIKPMQKRFWLRSAALNDANGITADLQTLLDTKGQRSTAS